MPISMNIIQTIKSKIFTGIFNICDFSTSVSSHSDSHFLTTSLLCTVQIRDLIARLRVTDSDVEMKLCRGSRRSEACWLMDIRRNEFLLSFPSQLSPPGAFQPLRVVAVLPTYFITDRSTPSQISAPRSCWRQLSYAIKNQLKAHTGHFLPFTVSLWHKDAYEKFFPITTHRKSFSRGHFTCFEMCCFGIDLGASIVRFN